MVRAYWDRQVAPLVRLVPDVPKAFGGARATAAAGDQANRRPYSKALTVLSLPDGSVSHGRCGHSRRTVAFRQICVRKTPRTLSRSPNVSA